MSVYFQVLLLSLIIPLIFSFHPKIKFHKKFDCFLKANIIVLIPFVIWDIIFVKLGVWGFNTNYLQEVFVLNLPIEEILFFVIIPFCCVFTYEVFTSIKINIIKNNKLVYLSYLISIFLLVLSIFYRNNLYTSITFLLLSITLAFIAYNKKEILKHFFLTYIVITCIPFIVVNGVLTGGTLPEPPVWYNNNEIIGIRIWTIPIEDFAYSMMLLILNISMYEKFKTNKSHQENSL